MPLPSGRYCLGVIGRFLKGTFRAKDLHLPRLSTRLVNRPLGSGGAAPGDGQGTEALNKLDNWFNYGISMSSI